MDSKQVRKISNRVVFWSVIVFFYWLFIFTVITVFDLKIFREKLTELFFISILGIMALVAAAFAVNILANITIIADSVSGEKPGDKSNFITRTGLIVFLISFPVIMALLFGGNQLTVRKKHEILERTAQKILHQYQDDLEYLGNFNLTRKYLDKSEDILKVIGSIDNSFPNVEAIHRVKINGKDVFIGIERYRYVNNTDKLKITDFIYTSDSSERDYMNSVLNNRKTNENYFESHKGNYKLIIPVETSKNKIFFMLLTDYQQYGKLGS